MFQGFLRIALPCALSMATLAAAPQPTAYSLTQHNTLTQVAVTEHIYRDGDKVTLDSVFANGQHIRQTYDLKNQREWSWDPDKLSIPCTGGFGSWGDPFQWFEQTFGGDLSELKPKQVGTETVAGLPSKILLAQVPQVGKVKVWLDDTYGLMVKMAMPASGGHEDTVLEVTQFSASKPPASAFALPSICANVRQK